MHFSLVLIDHPKNGLIKAFDDAILPISFGLRRLGYEVEILQHRVNPKSRNIIFGSANDPALTGLDVPADSVVLNLEQLSAENSVWNTRAYLEHLRHFAVWDYSRRNIEYLSAQGIKADLLTLGYVPEMTRLRTDFPVSHDVLFYGLASPRRQTVLNKLKTQGVRVNQPPVGTFSRERDLAIADSRLYLNIHHYQPATLEVVRLGYLWANHKPVVSELRPDTEVYPGLEEACAYCVYEELADQVQELLSDQSKLNDLARSGFEAFSALNLEESLEHLVGRRTIHGLGTRLKEPRPKHLHAGSGRDFRNEALNIDINPICNPDLVLDLSKPLDPGVKYHTERFGEIELAPSAFESITAYEFLEHVADLPQTMRNFLDLLEEGGRLTASVPYDLSRGAWQVPTHVRAFNENSWLYYTDYAWYLGWGDFRFELDDISFTLSHLGAKLLTRCAGRERLTTTPRAIDSMTVILRKCRATEEEKFLQQQISKNVYARTQITWETVHEDRNTVENERRAVFRSPAAWHLAKLRLWGCTVAYYFYKTLALLGLCPEKKNFWKAKRNRWRRLVSLER